MMLKRFLLFGIVLSILSCGGGDGDGGDSNPQPPVTQAPSAATLIFPEDDTECNISEILSETQSVVPFEWNASENTDSYRISIRNLNTGSLVASSPEVTSPQAMVTLERGTPYEWSVVSLANGTNQTATSATFRFFNEGPGIENYAPFPAEAVNPARGATITATTTANLQWTASDIDNDDLSFVILFDTNDNPTTEIGALSENNLEVSITPGTIYFWRVITMDSANNSSQSEIFQFRVSQN